MAASRRDLALWAAGLTFFAILAAVPLLLLAVRGAAVLAGPEFVRVGARALADALPREGGVRRLTDAALTTPWWTMLVALLPATFYGEGLRRSLRQVARQPPGAFTGWKGRVGFLPVVVAGAPLTVMLLATMTAIEPWRVWSVVVTFHVLWVAVSVCACLIYWVSAPSWLDWRIVVLCGFGTGAVLSGFLHGFLLFLAIPVDWDAPFAGLPHVGAVTALGLWLYLLHVLLLMGFRVALVLGGGARWDDTREGRG